ncbi:HAD-IB family hydrolase [Sphingomonas sp. BK235]|uniref:HAD family hydrolase n=1 Tax=Sphingomonas sp. BK235 TaxID=2512131 RepID=UPI0010507C23|nr:HAD-IB family hydrolase [Sphingomonas sp. BK235]TCP36672.1 HAD superfamily hydrolase (TIGR01490 family) [Sphingomonas sp. BK235]
MPRFAFYDLDRTVTRLPTWSAFLFFAAARRAPWRLALLPLLAAPALAQRAGWISRDRLKEVMHALFLGRALPAAAEARLAADFAARVLARNIRPGARAQIAADRAAGYRVVLATAAHRFYAEAIARALGIEDVIATEARRTDDGALAHLLDGANVYGAAKLAAVERWLAARGVARGDAWVRVYSDHASDAPSLAFADEGFAVNPHRRLRALAAERHWPVLDWSARAAPIPAPTASEQPACAR